MMAPSLLEPPPTALLAKSTPHPSSVAGTVRTRDEAGWSSPSPGAPERPTKRSRVRFAPEIQEDFTQGWEKGLDLTREEVQRAIESHRLGDDAAYARVKEVFTMNPTADDAPSPIAMRNYVVALISVASRLNKTCSGLVHAVLACNWLGRDEKFVLLYIRLLGNIVSAHGGFVGVVLGMIVDNLASVPFSARRLPGYPPVKKSQIHARSHIALRYLLELVPSASSALLGILSANFPHSSHSRRAHVDFVKNLLKIIQYVPELKAEILALITERLVKIDVQVQVDMDDLEEGVEDKLLQGERNSQGTHLGDADDDSASCDSSTSSIVSMDEETRRLKDLKSNVRKMDAILEELFQFYCPLFETPSSKETDRAFDMLLNHFTNIILPTYRSRHSQFLLFHFAQTSENLIDKFAGMCVYIASDQARPTLLKQSAAAYLASFVARGTHVSAQIVQDVFTLLGAHLDRIRADHESSCQGPNLRRFGTFYSLAQALLYIFCFRWRDLTTYSDGPVEEDEPVALENEEMQWTPGIKEILSRAIYSKFNPLKVCSPSIVNEFASIANHLRFMYVYPLLESNKRLHLYRSAASSCSQIAPGRIGHDINFIKDRDDSPQQLDAYFPFDPYNLPISKKWLEGDYVDWQGVPGLHGRSHVDEDENEEEENSE